MIGEIFLTFAVIYLIFSLGNYLNAKAIEARRAATVKQGAVEDESAA